MNLILVFLLIYAVRLASVFVVQTFYVPDEYWQSLEVAHKLTFGYGYLTWEWVQGIRSYIYPLIIAAVYKLLALLSLDTVQNLVLWPRILQATLSAYADYRFYVWSNKKKWALFFTLVSWFSFYIGSRTLVNTLEASLVTIGLSYYPLYNDDKYSYIWIAALSCYLRPTAAIVWLPLVALHLYKTKYPLSHLILKRFLPIGLLVGIVCAAIDSYMHGSLLITPYNFLKFNVLENIGSFYGSHSWYWYWAVGTPAVLGINVLAFGYGVFTVVRDWNNYPVRKSLLLVLATSLTLLSAIEHKEFRFVAPLLPIFLYIGSDAMTRWSYKAPSWQLWTMAVLLLAGNALPAWYVSTRHQSGPVEAIAKVQEIARDYRDEGGRRASVLFVMPCHSTPYYSHVHENITMRFLTCEPNLKRLSNYKCESDNFFESPVHWLRSHVPVHPRHARPTHVVLYESIAPVISEFLQGYKLLQRISNAGYASVDHKLLFNQLVTSVLENRLTEAEFMEHLKFDGAKNILVYQRLRADEENAFNREEYQTVPLANEDVAFEDAAAEQQNQFN